MAFRADIDSACHGTGADIFDVDWLSLSVDAVAAQRNSAEETMVGVDIKDKNPVPSILQIVPNAG